MVDDGGWIQSAAGILRGRRKAGSSVESYRYLRTALHWRTKVHEFFRIATSEKKRSSHLE